MSKNTDQVANCVDPDQTALVYTVSEDSIPKNRVIMRITIILTHLFNEMTRHTLNKKGSYIIFEEQGFRSSWHSSKGSCSKLTFFYHKYFSCFPSTSPTDNFMSVSFFSHWNRCICCLNLLELFLTQHLWDPCLFVGVEVSRPSQPDGVMVSSVSLPNHMFTGQA